MRVTQFMTYDRIVRSIRQGMEDFTRLNEQLSSGKRILKPSDDIIASARAMDYRLTIGTNQQYQRNITLTRATYEITDRALTSAGDSLASLKQIMMGFAGGSATPEQRETYAEQMDFISGTLRSIANTRSGDRYIFSGYKTDVPAYDSTGAYQGDDGVMNVMIGPGASVAINEPGSEVFSAAPAAAKVVELAGGRFAHFTPGAGTTTNVEIRDTNDTTVIDTFSYDNCFDIAALVSTELTAGSPNYLRIEALQTAVADAVSRVRNVQSDFGVRGAMLNDMDTRLGHATVSVQNALSRTEEADLTSVIAEINKTDTALQALREASKIIMSQSLMDFLS